MRDYKIEDKIFFDIQAVILKMSEMQIFSSIEQMAQHAMDNGLILVSHQDTVYELSDFQDIHPGGAWMIKAFSGQCIDEVMFNKFTHKHKSNVMDKLTQFVYGYIDQDKEAQDKDKENTRSISVVVMT